jgi:hypothetical protein
MLSKVSCTNVVWVGFFQRESKTGLSLVKMFSIPTVLPRALNVLESGLLSVSPKTSGFTTFLRICELAAAIAGRRSIFSFGG